MTDEIRLIDGPHKGIVVYRHAGFSAGSYRRFIYMRGDGIEYVPTTEIAEDCPQDVEVTAYLIEDKGRGIFARRRKFFDIPNRKRQGLPPAD